MTLFEIKHRLSGAVLFKLEAESLKLCVEAAVKGRANLRGADLSGADLSDANLNDADLRGVGHVIDLGSPNSWNAHAWLRDGWLSIRVGCQEKRLSEARDYWAGKDSRREVMAAVDYAEAVALLRGWPILAPAEQEAA